MVVGKKTVNMQSEAFKLLYFKILYVIGSILFVCHHLWLIAVAWVMVSQGLDLTILELVHQGTYCNIGWFLEYVMGENLLNNNMKFLLVRWKPAFTYVLGVGLTFPL